MSTRRAPRRTARLAVLVAAVVATVLLVVPASSAPSVTLLFFGTETCPYCQLMDDHLDALVAAHDGEVEVEHVDVASGQAAQERYVAELAARGLRPSGVPVVMLGERVWVGYDERVAAEIDAAVAAVLAAAREDVPATGPPPPPPDADTVPGSVELPVVGEVSLAGRSAVATTALIALVDGVNPCSLWVLTVLLAMVLNAGASRARTAAVGGTFLLVTGLLYGAFILGVFTILGFVEHLGAVRVVVAALALGVGAVNVKDFVAFKRGPSLTIPDASRPRIYRAGRAVRDPGRSLPVVLGITVAMAAGIALVELPCTAGFPVVWSGIVRTQGIEGAEFAALLGLYLLLYVLDEVVLFAVVVATLEVTRFQERHGRWLKLVGGSVMLVLGGVLLVAPEVMERLAGAAVVLLGAVALALAVAGLHRWRGGAGDEVVTARRRSAGDGRASADRGGPGGTVERSGPPDERRDHAARAETSGP